MFPYFEITKQEAIIDYNRIQDSTYKNAGQKCANFYFQKYRFQTPRLGNTSQIDFWNKHKGKIISEHKTKADYRRALSFKCPVSQFKTKIALSVYQTFNATNIFDPYAGWGNRCLAALALNISYLGMETNIDLKVPFAKMLEDIEHSSQIQIIFKPAEDHTHTKIYDLIFTSPPFEKNRTIVEKYKHMKKYYNFIDQSLIPTLINAWKKLKTNGTLCINIPSYMLPKLEEIWGPPEILYYNRQSTTKIGSINEPLYYWIK